MSAVLVLRPRVRNAQLLLPRVNDRALERCCPSCSAPRGYACMRSGGAVLVGPWVFENWKRYRDLPYPAYVCEARNIEPVS